ncbi:MAG: hypothetical protein LBM75_08765 [Myxococcales bacterium]|jgi:hypothetical protein|nr:hypothetical protein [Myxococcales bacterium]
MIDSKMGERVAVLIRDLEGISEQLSTEICPQIRPARELIEELERSLGRCFAICEQIRRKPPFLGRWDIGEFDALRECQRQISANRGGERPAMVLPGQEEFNFKAPEIWGDR